MMSDDARKEIRGVFVAVAAALMYGRVMSPQVGGKRYEEEVIDQAEGLVDELYRRGHLDVIASQIGS